jgi:hypothetical protein
LQFGAENAAISLKVMASAMATSEPPPDQMSGPASTGRRKRTKSPGEEALPATRKKRDVTETHYSALPVLRSTVVREDGHPEPATNMDTAATPVSRKNLQEHCPSS